LLENNLIMKKTKEPQYNICLDLHNNKGSQSFGIMSNHTWVEDPKRLIFLLARYKFVAKMFTNYTTVMEVGCADAFGSRVVAQEVKQLSVSDFDPIFIADAKRNNCLPHTYQAMTHDILDGPFKEKYEGIYSLDVLEHISKDNEHTFLKNIIGSLTQEGTAIIGMPSIQSQAYASPQSKEGHVNCKDGMELKSLLSTYFNNVFIFSMNDEVVHTGFYPMAHYLIALCCSPKT